MSAAIAPGSNRSSASRNASHSPRATARPRFRARETPSFSGASEQDDARVALGDGLHHVGRPVVGPVVDDDALERHGGLVDDGGERSFDG